MYLEKNKNVFIFVTQLQIDFEYIGQNTFLFKVLQGPNIILKHLKKSSAFLLR